MSPTSLFTPADWMVNDGSKYNDKGDIVKDAAMGGWVKIYPNGTKELLHALKTLGNAAPTIISVTNQANGTYSSPETLAFTVTFSEAVTVAGVPKLQVYTEEGEIFFINYASGTGTAALVFSGNTSGIANGNLALVTELEIGAGSIVDAATNTANDDFPSNYVQPTGIVMDTTGIVSLTNMADGLYTSAETLTFEVEFENAVTITGTGTPKLLVTTDPNHALITATELVVTAGSGTDTLTFTGPATDQLDGDLFVFENLTLGTSLLSDAVGNPAYLAFPADYVQPAIELSTAVPIAVANMADATYTNAAVLTFTVEFSHPVTIGGTGTPVLKVYTNIGAQKSLPVTAGDGTATLTFSGAATGAANGTLVVVETLSLGTSTLKDANDNNAILDFPDGYGQPTITITTP